MSDNLLNTIIDEVKITLEEKQKGYGDTFGITPEILKLLYKHKYNEGSCYYELEESDFNDILTMARVIDKLIRVTHGNYGDESAWRDITGYSILAEAQERKNHS